MSILSGSLAERLANHRSSADAKVLHEGEMIVPGDGLSHILGDLSEPLRHITIPARHLY